MNEIYLRFRWGGSKVVCLVANDRGELLGYGVGDSINTNYVLYDEAKDAAVKAIQTAINQAGIEGELIDQTVISAPIDPATLNMVLLECNLHNVHRAAEGETSRWSARFWTDLHVGVTVDAGTGSLSRGWTIDGRVSGAGGFGTTLGDEGSGAWISLRAISSVLQSYDGRLEETGLTGAVLKHFSLSQVQDLPYRVLGGYLTTEKMIELKNSRDLTRFSIDSGHVITDEPKSEDLDDVPINDGSIGGLFFKQFHYGDPLTHKEVASFCPRVVALAYQGDDVARAILEEAGRELGRLASAVIRRLGMQSDKFAIVPFGGVFKSGALILDPFLETCTVTAPNAEVVFPKFESEVGAIFIALDDLGVCINSQVITNIEQSSKKFPACLGR